MPFVRVVRFTDVSPERIDELVSRIEQSDGPPEGVPSTGLQLIHDTEQSTAVVVQFYETMDDLQTGAAVFEAMPSTDTPGSRASVDSGEIKVDRKV